MSNFIISTSQPKDTLGRPIYTEDELCYAFLKNPDIDLDAVVTSDEIHFDVSLGLSKTPHINKPDSYFSTVEEMDIFFQNSWKMPDEYKNFDIVSWVVMQCKTEHELQRVAEELLLYSELGAIDLLRYLKYLVDFFKEHDIIYGIGRGSSVASYVLYLIGVHRIDSLYYDLPISEFLTKGV
jgi:DNA polymerase III alpha subunit